MKIVASFVNESESLVENFKWMAIFFCVGGRGQEDSYVFSAESRSELRTELHS